MPGPAMAAAGGLSDPAAATLIRIRRKRGAAALDTLVVEDEGRSRPRKRASSSSLTRAFGALSTAEGATTPAAAPRVFVRVDTFTLEEAARLGASLGQSAASVGSDEVSERLQSKVLQMQEQRKLARSIGLKKATAHAAGSRAAVSSPRRLDTSKLNRYAAVRQKRNPATAAGDAATAAKATTIGKPLSEHEDKQAAASAAAQGDPAGATHEMTVGSAAEAALLELAAEVAAAEDSHAKAVERKPKWDVVEVDLGGGTEAARKAQKDRLSSLLSNYSGSNAGSRGALTCNGVAMVASPVGADGAAGDGGDTASAGSSRQCDAVETASDDEWEYDYYAVVNPGASSNPGSDLDLGWMGAVEMDATGGHSQAADPWDSSRAAVVVMKYAMDGHLGDDDEEWASDGEGGGWDSDLSDTDGQEYDYPDESDDERRGGWNLAGSSDSSAGGHGADDY